MDTFQVPCITTFLMFLSGLLVMVSPGSRWALVDTCHRITLVLCYTYRLLSRVWIVMGAVMVASSWVSSLTENYTDSDKSEVWFNICMVRKIWTQILSPFKIFIAGTNSSLHNNISNPSIGFRQFILWFVKIYVLDSFLIYILKT